MITKEDPYNDINDSLDDFANLVVFEEKMPYDMNINPRFLDLFKRIFDFSPKRRIKISELEEQVHLLLKALG